MMNMDKEDDNITNKIITKIQCIILITTKIFVSFFFSLNYWFKDWTLFLKKKYYWSRIKHRKSILNLNSKKTTEVDL